MLRNRDNSTHEQKTIGIVAPSFFIEKEQCFERGIEYLEKRGYSLKFGETVHRRLYNTTDRAIARARDINAMFADSDVDLIVATDGGCRAIEVLEHLDYELIKKNPKPICGFSDITHILLAIYTKTGNPVVHGIDVINGFGQDNSECKDQNLELFWRLIGREQTQMSLREARVLKKGVGTGVVMGGWLNAIHNLKGTLYFPNEEKIILFWEAIDEEPNRINMMLQSLRLSGLFDCLAGMVVGKLSNCTEREYFDCIPSMDEIILAACEGYDFPIIVDAPFGHEERKCAFQYGTQFKINTEDLL